MHRDPLEIPLVTRAARDRVAGESRLRLGPRRAELAHGGRVERVAQSERAEPPEGGEREVVEGEHRRPVAPGGSGHRQRRAGAGSPVISWVSRWRRSRTVKRASTNGSPSAGPIALGEHLVVSGSPRPLDAIEDRRPAQGRVGSDDQMGDMAPASPRAEPGPGVPEAQGLLSHGHMQG